MNDEYKIDNHKLMYHPERVHQWYKGFQDWETAKKIYPIYIEVSPIGICNHRCTFCAVDYIGYQNRRLDPNILKQRLSEMHELGVKSFMFAGEGEPTLYKELPEIIEHCGLQNIDTSLTTNMVPFTAKSTLIYIKYCKWIKVSINAGNAETYSKIHNTSEKDFHKVIENLRLSVSLKQKMGSACTIGTQMVLLPDNIHTALDLAQTVKDIGVDYLVIKPYSQHHYSKTKKYQGIDYQQYLHLEKELQKFNTSAFTTIFRLNTMNKLIHNPPRYTKCNATPFFWAYIMANGDVYGCSAYLEQENFCYGNLNDTAFSDIWEGKKREENYHFIQKELDIKNCRTNCRMDEVNRYLWDLQNPHPHVNFI